MPDYTALSKAVSYVLRHAPWEYELELDEEGWVPVADLLAGLHTERQFAGTTAADLAVMIEKSEKKRHELQGERIRALYGHSVPGKLLKIRATPPEILYHGTARAFLEAIQTSGIKSMRRQYVHLSVDIPTAQSVAHRKGNNIVLLEIPARRAHDAGIAFYQGNDKVWLADKIPPQWFSVRG